MLGLQYDIPLLEQELFALDGLFVEISHRCDSVRKALECHKAALAPIRRLPQDVLLEIFANIPTNALVPTNAPWVVGQVCFLWRSISLSHPSLWSEIFLDGYYAVNRHQKQQALATILTRSKNHPLTIRIDALRVPNNYHFPDHPSNPIGDLSILAAHGSHWTALELHMNSTDLVHMLDLIDQRNKPLDHLRNLHITTIRMFDNSRILYKPVFSSSPILHCFLQGIAVFNLWLPLQNMGTFTYEMEYPNELPQLLEQAKKLRALQVIPTNFVTAEYKGPVVNHAALRCLTIYTTFRREHALPKVPHSIDGISLPGLVELRLLKQDIHNADIELFTPEDMLQMCNMLQRSHCSLKILSISSPLPFSAMSQLLIAHGQSLTAVHLFVDKHNAFQLFHGLSAHCDMPGTPISAEHTILPNLQRLELTEIHHYHAGFRMLEECVALFHAVESRISNKSIQKLSTVKLVLQGTALNHLREEPMVASSLLHIIGLKQIGSSRGLTLSLIVGEKDLLQNYTWLGLLGPY